MSKNKKWLRKPVSVLVLLSLMMGLAVFNPQLANQITTDLFDVSITASATTTGQARRDALVRIANAEPRGELARDNKYTRWHGRIRSGVTWTYNYDWCAVFVSWCANQAGIPTSVIPKEPAVSNMRAFFEGNGRFRTPNNYTPRAGDVVFVTSGHVGIVVRVSGNNITTIEGNTHDGNNTNKRGVFQRTRSISSMVGFGLIDNPPTNQPTQSQRTYTVQNASGSRTRTGAGTNFSQVGAVARGSVIRYTETRTANGFTWIRVESGSTFASGSWGTITGQWLAMQSSTTVQQPTQPTVRTHTIQASSGANVRSGAGTGFGRVGAVARGSVIRYTETKSANGFTWVRIQSGSTFTNGTWGSNVGNWVALL
jgi:uncharacterized protein YraI